VTARAFVRDPKGTTTGGRFSSDPGAAKPLEGAKAVERLVGLMSDAYAGGLEQDENFALDNYVGPGHYGPINMIQRQFNGDVDAWAASDPYNRAQITTQRRNLAGLDSVFAKAPALDQDVVVYRSVYGEMFANVKVGDELTDNGYISTTVQRRIAEDWATNGTVFKIRVPKGTKAVYPNSLLANPNAREQEVLLRRHRFRVTKIAAGRGRGGNRVIELDVAA